MDGDEQQTFVVIGTEKDAEEKCELLSREQSNNKRYMDWFVESGPHEFSISLKS